MFFWVLIYRGHDMGGNQNLLGLCPGSNIGPILTKYNLCYSTPKTIWGTERLHPFLSKTTWLLFTGAKMYSSDHHGRCAQYFGRHLDIGKFRTMSRRQSWPNNDQNNPATNGLRKDRTQHLHCWLEVINIRHLHTLTVRTLWTTWATVRERTRVRKLMMRQI